jgi:arginyl-tRNA synthetase
VLQAECDEQRLSRLRLCDLTARTIERGLNLLGIQVVERM